MNDNKRKVRALGLCSGGLDSMLAGLVLRNSGIVVEWVAFETPFFSAVKARKASSMTGIPLTVKPIYPIFIELLKNPPAGYGKHMNPCMDCHTLMFRLAGEIMRERGFDFLFSGEVMGQRPMSQKKTSLRYVEKHSGFDGYIVRPLSGRILPQTIPEKEGLIDREMLLDIRGRGRKYQIKLAAEFGIKEYPAPAGGCLLTDRGYSKRLKDLLAHQDHCSEEELHLLRFGRHYRLNPGTKLIVGRTEEDNENILKYHDPTGDIIIDVKDYPSPIALIPRGAEKQSLLLAASICTGHSNAPKLAPVKVLVKTAKKQKTLKVIALQPKDVRKLMIN